MSSAVFLFDWVCMSKRFSSAFLSDTPATRPFYPVHFSQDLGRRHAVSRAQSRLVASSTVDALRQLNSGFVRSAQRNANIESLRQPGTVVVVTGQQVGLFLGPLYTIYKAATAVRVARALEEQTGARCVPVFWLQTEDHDFDEIASCFLPRSDGSVCTLSVKRTRAARVSLSQDLLGEDLGDCFAELQKELGTLPYAAEHIAQLARHYRPGVGVVSAFAGLLGELFSESGLVLLDPTAEAFSGAASAVHRRAILQAEEIAAVLQERNQQLHAAGFSTPVHIRPSAPLSFFHPQGRAGARYRLAPASTGATTPTEYTLVGADGQRTWSQADLLSLLQKGGAHFSTSALLRPIFQDTLLPTAAYIAGPGEIDYFAQMQPLYSVFDLPTPLLVPRGHFYLVDERRKKLMQMSGIDVHDARNEDTVLRRLVSVGDAAKKGAAPAPQSATGPALGDLPGNTLAEELQKVFQAHFAKLSGPVVEAHPELRKAADKTLGTVSKAIARFADKAQDAGMRAQKQHVETARRLNQMLYPQGKPQERLVALPFFAARYGASAFVALVLRRYRPWQTEFMELDV